MKRRDYLCRVLQSWSPPSGGRWCCPLPENPPLPESSPLSGDSPLALGGAALLLHKPAVRYQRRQSIHAHLTAESNPYTYAGGCFGYSVFADISKDRVSMRTSQRKANHILTLGAALEKSCRVRQGCLGRTPCCRSRFVLDDNHRTLALFAALWARVLKRNKFRVKQMRYKTNSKD